MDEDKSIDVGELVRKLESANLALKSIGRCMGLTDELRLVDSGDYTGFSTAVNDTVVEINIMPYDYEWPRFSGVETVKIGNGFTDRAGIGRTVASIRFYDSDFSIYSDDGTSHYYSYGEAVAPAPVLAADGKPLEAGQTVYGIENGIEYKVCDFDEGGPIVEYWDGGICVHVCASPTQLTHTRPEQTRTCGNCAHFQQDPTTKLCIGACWNRYTFRDGDTYYEARKGDYSACKNYESKECHAKPEPPDSWERLEEDARNIRTAILDSDKLPFEVIDERALDLVRRAKKLSERGE